MSSHRFISIKSFSQPYELVVESLRISCMLMTNCCFCLLPRYEFQTSRGTFYAKGLKLLSEDSTSRGSFLHISVYLGFIAAAQWKQKRLSIPLDSDNEREKQPNVLQCLHY